MHQSKNNPHILREISTNILTKMANQKELVTENSVSLVW